jgi:hypothetical protein
MLQSRDSNLLSSGVIGKTALPSGVIGKTALRNWERWSFHCIKAFDF